jgi:hypothetical protein
LTSIASLNRFVLQCPVGFVWTNFAELVTTPFRRADLAWGIGPLYFAWLFNELTSAKRSFHTAIQTGFSFLWCGAHWLWQYFQANPGAARNVTAKSLVAVNLAVTFLVLVLGLFALVAGLRRKYPRYGSFLGHTRFSNYFMIAIFPIQAGALDWTWERVLVIVLFAVPTWAIVHLGLAPFRR